MAIGVVANTNVASISSSRILAGNRASMERAMERLASGKRINSAADDAAGMAVAAKIRSDVRSLDQAIRNSNDAVSLINTYDGAATEIEAILVRMRELSVQVANGTYENDDRDQAQLEFGFLQTEIDRIAANTQFNRKVLAASGGNSFTFQIGPTDADVLSVTLAALDTGTLGIDSGSISTQSNAQDAAADVDDALALLSTARAEAGSYSNRLSYTINNLMSVSQRQKEALSGIEDADYAAESANLARGTVLAQAGTAMLAQANQAPQYILTLLRG
jgi:flagellin